MDCSHAYTAYLVSEEGLVELNWQEEQTETLISRDVLTALVRDANAFRRM